MEIKSPYLDTRRLNLMYFERIRAFNCIVLEWRLYYNAIIFNYINNMDYIFYIRSQG